MAKFSFHSNSQNITHFRVRLIAKLALIFIWLTLLAHRLIRYFTAKQSISQLGSFLFTSVPFLSALILIVLIEYFVYRKIGVRILQFSKYVDIVFTLLYTGEWMLLLNTQLEAYEGDETKLYSIYNAIGWTAFGWRALLPILITPLWQLRIIPHTAVSIYLLVFAVINQRELELVILFRGLFQVVYVVLIYYLDDKIHFTMMIGNVQKEQWLKLNDFILNNIPENIAILDSTGNPNFLSDSFKKLMQRHNQSQDVKKFLGNIKQIQRIQQDRDTDADSDYFQELLPLEGVPSSESKNDLPGDTNYNIETINTLEDLIVSFGHLINHGSVKERSIQIFAGKYKQGDEQERSFEIKISYINQDPKKYILLILRDTTQRDRLLTLEGNIKYKDQLLASVSHELRTPLNGNINLIEAAIKSKEIPDKIKDTFLTPAVRSSQFLLHLINDILDMSQMKAQKLRLIFQQASLQETLHNTVQLLELHAKKKGLTLEMNLDRQLPGMFCTDHVRLSQIVLNLINNSIKFTQKGHVRLSACPLKDSDSDYVSVSVEDTGIGMAQEDTSKLFHDFTHIDFKNRQKINPTGVGLGLKIANDLSRLLGPENNKGISVTSELGHGSTFSFLIENKETGLNSQETRLECREELSPLVASEFQTAIDIGLETKLTRNISIKSLCSIGKIDIPSLISIPTCTCARVLVVDDDPFNILAYEAILNSLGIKYDCVYNGKSAIGRMLTKVRYPCSSVCCPYRVVFMDEEMPEMTGRETVLNIVNLQQQNLLPPMAIIGCTAHHDGEAIESFMRSGIAEYIPKPVSAATIQKILEKYNV